MYKVKFMKYIVKGPLKGIAIDTVLTFATLSAAMDYMGFLMKHTKKPVSAIGNGDYTCHVIRME